MKTTILLLSAILTLTVSAYIKNVSAARDTARMYAASAEYWNTIGSIPPIACRLRQGAYHETSVMVTFGTGRVTKGYVCEDAVINPGHEDTGGLILQLN